MGAPAGANAASISRAAVDGSSASFAAAAAPTWRRAWARCRLGITFSDATTLPRRRLPVGAPAGASFYGRTTTSPR
ncbi:MAG: hypothetical protein EKK55_24780 [Rhodocyclaceae bacterium]|nr:MAG: hypothetical protein EKK55_24780 [Rhodocyclaceae bacterium]